jgi:hypothetical protein
MSLRPLNFPQFQAWPVEVCCVDWWKIQVDSMVDPSKISVNHSQDVTTTNYVQSLVQLKYFFKKLR